MKELSKNISFVAAAFMLALGLLVAGVGGSVGALASQSGDSGAFPPKTGVPPASPNASGQAHSSTPEPGSKNKGDVVAGAGVSGTGQLLPKSSKNAAPKKGAPVTVTSPAAASPYLSCGASPGSNWTTTNIVGFDVAVQCSLNVPEDGSVFIKATASAALSTGGSAYEGHYRLGIDNLVGLGSTDRFVDVYPDAGDGGDRSLALSVLSGVGPGLHNFMLLGQLSSGSGPVLLYDPTISVIFVPNSSPGIRLCGVASGTNWDSTAPDFQPIIQCTIDAPQSGYVYLSAGASAGLPSGGSPYEARFRLAVDGGTGLATTDRWQNVYTDAGDGTDEAVSDSVLVPVTAGQRTISFLAARYSPSGTVHLFDPTLSAIFIPANEASVNTCSATSADRWESTSTSFQIVQQCQINVPSDGIALLDGNGSTALYGAGAANNYEAQFRLGIDNADGSDVTDRWVNVYDDNGGDGTDRQISDSVVSQVAAGLHTFVFVGKQYAGAGRVVVYAPSLSVLVIHPSSGNGCGTQFNDVPASNTFSPSIICLSCRGIISGYPCGGPGEPCPGSYFRPGAPVSRGQAAKIIATSANYTDNIPGDRRTFADVPPGSPFWLVIERIAAHGAISGYTCGGPGEPCDSQQRKYYRPGANLSRGQLAKIVTTVAGYNEAPNGQIFADVPQGGPNSDFYLYVERASIHGIIGGYPCGGPGEPCDAQNRPYYRPGNIVTRGQTAKIVSNAFFPNCPPQ